MIKLRRVIGVTKEGKIRNEYIRYSIEAASVVDNIRENYLRCLGHDLKRKEMEVVRW